jgi:hypothetical protein
MKTFLNSRDDIMEFLKNYATVYNLNECSNKKSLILYNNIEFGGRVANFIIDKNDIDYFTNILKVLGLLETPKQIITYEYLNEHVIETLIQWIQLRLNTAVIYKYNYWDFLNTLYLDNCFNVKSFNSLAKKSKNSNTNIRNIFFGDCREHEVLLHVLLKLYLEYHKLTDEYIIFKYYGYGTTITQINKTSSSKISSISKNKKFELSKTKGGSKSSSSINTSFPNIDNIKISTWEHTHPLLYIVSSNKLIALDALGHKTYLNPNMIERHNVELKIERIEDIRGKYKYSIWYNTLKDKESRIYVENPTPFSNNEPYIIKADTKINGKIVGFDFNLKKLESSKNYDRKYFILNLANIDIAYNREEIIQELCLNT